MMTHTLLSVAALLGAVGLGRLSRRHAPQLSLRDPKLWTNLTVFLLVVGIIVALVTTADSRNDLAGKLDCRSNLSTPVNDATARLTASQARALVVIGDNLLSDPKLSGIVTDHLGATGPAELRRQVLSILDSSDKLDAANARRGDPVQTCADGSVPAATTQPTRATTTTHP